MDDRIADDLCSAYDDGYNDGYRDGYMDGEHAAIEHGALDYIMPVDGPERCRYQCSECHRGALLDYWSNDVKSLFCPTCGACMDQEGKRYWEEYDGELRLVEDG